MKNISRPQIQNKLKTLNAAPPRQELMNFANKVAHIPHLGSLNQLIDEVNGVVAVVRLAHHLGDTVWADAII